MFKKLDPLLHSQLRLEIMSLLINLQQAEFSYLKENTNGTSGNISLQLKKLEKANYITIEKGFKNNYPITTSKITDKGIKAFEEYVNDLKKILNNKK